MDKALLMEALDIGTVEVEAYLKILSANGLRASAVARMVDVPRPKIYEVLGRLIERGLIIEVKEGVAQFYPVRPDLAMDQIRSESRAVWERRDSRIHQLADSLLRVYEQRGPQMRGYDIVRVWSGKDMLLRKSTLMNETRDEFLGVFTSPYDHETGEDVRQAAFRMAIRGVTSRYIWSRELIQLEAVQEVLREQELPWEMRWSPSPEGRLEIYDRRVALVSDAPDPDQSFGDLRFEEYRQKAVVQLLHDRFQELWEEARPVQTPLPADWRLED